MSRTRHSSTPLGHRGRQSQSEDGLSEEYPYIDDDGEEAAERSDVTERAPLLPIFSSQQLGMLLSLMILSGACSTSCGCQSESNAVNG